MSVCNFDCFNCVYPDCINNEPENKTEERRIKRENAKARGLCVICMKSAATHGLYCEECYERKRTTNAKYGRARREKAKAAGLCIMCTKRPAVIGAYCETCKIKARGYDAAQRKRKKEMIVHESE